MLKKYISPKRLAQYDEKIKIVVDEKDANVLASAKSYVDEKVEEVAGIDASNIYSKDEINSALLGKVDIIDGMGLSTNDYTNTDKEKLGAIGSITTTQIDALFT